MIYIFYGEDIVTSRQLYLDLKNKYISDNFQTINLNSNNTVDLKNWLYDSQTLFDENKVFFSEKLFEDKSVLPIVTLFDNKKGIDLIDYGEYKYLTAIKNRYKNLILKESKVPYTIFKLLDSIYPGNLNSVITVHHQLRQTSDDYLTMYMIQKHIKELILADNPEFKKTIPSWKLYKLIGQSKKWQRSKLIEFYTKLCRIEQQIKTSSTTYASNQALDILFCFYL